MSRRKQVSALDDSLPDGAWLAVHQKELDQIFDEGLASTAKRRLLFFTCETCAPCKALLRTGRVQRLCAHHGVEFVLIDQAALPEMTEAYDVQSWPTMILEQEGVGPVLRNLYGVSDLQDALHARTEYPSVDFKGVPAKDLAALWSRWPSPSRGPGVPAPPAPR